jgi:hypothetical protein
MALNMGGTNSSSYCTKGIRGDAYLEQLVIFQIKEGGGGAHTHKSVPKCQKVIVYSLFVFQDGTGHHNDHSSPYFSGLHLPDKNILIIPRFDAV